jgi:hypothetical protein
MTKQSSGASVQQKIPADRLIRRVRIQRSVGGVCAGLWVTHYGCLETVPPINTMSANSRRTALTIGGPEDTALRANTNDRSTACSTALTPARRRPQFGAGLQKEHRWRATGLPHRNWYGEQMALA